MRPQIYLACPRYASAEEHSILARYAGIDYYPDDEADLVDLAELRVCGSSLLPQTFNKMLAQAMDMRDKGTVTHFAMLHDDIWPDNGWLTALWREMRLTGSDLVSAVSPIKDQPAYRTSTAINSIDDPWKILSYIDTHDRKRLPTTFTAADVCGLTEELVVNTGCFLADLRHPAWDAFCDTGGFRFLTKFTREPDGSRLSWIQPEDWHMSRFLNSSGAKIAATFAVRLRHSGQAWWSNYDDPSGMPIVSSEHPFYQTEAIPASSGPSESPAHGPIR